MRRIKLLFITVASFFLTVPAWAHGDKVIPQVVDGAGVARTKFDITNLSPDQKVTRIKVLFFLDNGSPWSIPTNRGTVSEVSLNLGPFQTIRIETLGTTQSLTAGYAIIRNTEATRVYPDDFEVATTVFYEIRNGPNVIDTVSVPIDQPTRNWIVPVEIDPAQNLWTGFAIVNLTDGPNKVTLRLWEATEPLSGDPTDGGTREFTLNAKEHRARFLTQEGLFTDIKKKFKGMMRGFSEGPVAILALLQTSTPAGVQYATLVSAPLDSLRRNTTVYLPQGYALNADLPVVDYFFSEKDTLPSGYDDFTWDVRYETQSGTARRLMPGNGARIAAVGSRNGTQFDALTLEQIQNLSYTTTPIDMSDNSQSLAREFAFAIRTDLGRYVKVRIADVVTSGTSGTSGTNRDLALEIFVYK